MPVALGFEAKARSLRHSPLPPPLDAPRPKQQAPRPRQQDLLYQTQGPHQLPQEPSRHSLYTLELELAAKQDAITKQDAIIQARDSQLQHLHRTYKHLCKLFFKAACCDFTDPEIPDCLQPNPNHRAHTGRRPRSLADDAEQQATKEFRRILAASSRSSLGLSAPSSTDEPEPDV